MDHHRHFWLHMSLVFIGLLTGTACRMIAQSPPESTIKTHGGTELRFEELPGFVVELAYQYSSPSSSLSPHQSSRAAVDEDDVLFHSSYPICSGSHIGGGYILTAAHCVDHFLFTQDNCGGRDWERLVINILVTDSEHTTRRRKTLSANDVTAIVYHRGWRLPPHNHHLITAQTASLYDLALIKVDSKLPFADTAHLPQTTDDHHNFAQFTDDDHVWVYGVGGYQLNLSPTNLAPARSYFGGLAHIAKADYFQTLAFNQRIYEDPEQFKRQILNDHRLLASANRNFQLQMTPPKDPCRHGPTTSHNIFPPSLTELTSYLATSTSPHSYILPFTGGTRHDNPHEIISICTGDSGGPVLKALPSPTQKNVLLGVTSLSRNKGTIAHIINYLNRRHDKYTGCAVESTSTLGIAINVWQSLPWIHAARYSIAQGHHPPP